jgi:DNA-directed RNA polymerase subunit beta'
MTIKYLPILPPNLRPIIKLTDNNIVTSQINLLYIDIINHNNKIYKLKKMLIPNLLLNKEKEILQRKVDKVITDRTQSNKRLKI